MTNAKNMWIMEKFYLLCSRENDGHGVCSYTSCTCFVVGVYFLTQTFVNVMDVPLKLLAVFRKKNPLSLWYNKYALCFTRPFSYQFFLLSFPSRLLSWRNYQNSNYLLRNKISILKAYDWLPFSCLNLTFLIEQQNKAYVLNNNR